MKISAYLLVTFMMVQLINICIADAAEKTEDKEQSRIDPVIGAALLGAGAQVVTSDPKHNEVWQLPSGVKIDATSCWEDGSGPCPNGNCLDHKGQRGVLIHEKQVSCKWFCGWRADCKKQYCCNSA